MNEEIKIYEIPEQNLAKLMADIERLNKRADKLHVARIQVTTVKVEDREIKRKLEGGKEIKVLRKYHHLRIEGETPKFAGWTFAATISVTEAGNVLRKSPFVTREFPEYRDARPGCDHCQAERTRKETFLVLHESGEVKQLGRQCIRDFLGHQDPKQLASWAEIIFSLGELGELGEHDNYGCAYHEDRTFTVEYLQHCAEWTLREGFRTNKQVQEQQQGISTAALAWKSLEPVGEREHNFLRDHNFSISEQAVELASKAQALVIERLSDKPELNDFEHNLLTLARTAGFERKQGGIVAYIIGWYKRETERDAERQAQASARAQAKHWGTVGSRNRNIKLTYLGSSSFDSQWGVTWIHRFDLDGCRLVWKTGTCPDYDEGDVVELTFTIKAHSDYKGWPQTEITRCIVQGVTKKGN